MSIYVDSCFIPVSANEQTSKRANSSPSREDLHIKYLWASVKLKNICFVPSCMFFWHFQTFTWTLSSVEIKYIWTFAFDFVNFYKEWKKIHFQKNLVKNSRTQFSTFSIKLHKFPWTRPSCVWKWRGNKSYLLSLIYLAYISGIFAQYEVRLIRM